MFAWTKWDDRPWTARAWDWVLSWFDVDVNISLGRVYLIFRLRHYVMSHMTLQWFALMTGFGWYQTGVVVEQDDTDRVRRSLHVRGYLFGRFRETDIRLRKGSGK